MPRHFDRTDLSPAIGCFGRLHVPQREFWNSFYRGMFFKFLLTAQLGKVATWCAYDCVGRKKQGVATKSLASFLIRVSIENVLSTTSIVAAIFSLTKSLPWQPVIMPAMSYNRLLEKSNGLDENAERRRSSESSLRMPFNQDSSNHERIQRTLSFISTIMTPLFLFILFILLALNLRQASLVKDHVGREDVHNIYGSDTKYISLDHKYDYLWETAATQKWGVNVPLYPGGPEELGSIGMFHQLHCLSAFARQCKRR